jgi:hypothetical protein
MKYNVSLWDSLSPATRNRMGALIWHSAWPVRHNLNASVQPGARGNRRKLELPLSGTKSLSLSVQVRTQSDTQLLALLG